MEMHFADSLKALNFAACSHSLLTNNRQVHSSFPDLFHVQMCTHRFGRGILFKAGALGMVEAFPFLPVNSRYVPLELHIRTCTYYNTYT